MNATTLDRQEKTRGRGRPREFDADAALDAALRVFSERGYNAASISELTEAMGIAAGSVYKAFGDKRGIFLAVFDRYRAVRRGLLDARLAGVETGRDKLNALITFFASSSHGQIGRQGCLVVGSAGDLALFDEEAAARVAAAFTADETLLADLIRLGQSDGSISADLDVLAVALALLCLTKGMRVIGKTGRSGEQMATAAEAAMKLVT
ncbi:TetR/AcrR family transcriptional regulator [Rhizobium binxianense]|uniref:TetR/AcrR family transcriptional regulator n=1 Tax=Rhizobium binxianense TaxID=3024242 RepID=UPI0023604B74|nr:TetR/AcrR family transcriptional regulator [Rhizobium sp. MJ37]MDC9833905.1 TetR/AcrR family transcriptional regulator [Rhizobium sp. MJ37]